jgi:hypothetical protein
VMEGDGLGYFPSLEDVQESLLGCFVVGDRTPGALPPSQHVLHPKCSFPTLPTGALILKYQSRAVRVILQMSDI